MDEARAALARYAARFSFTDFPDFLVIVCRGDLSDIAGPLIMASTLADACALAAAIDAGPIWPDGVRAAAAWFQGANDVGQLMWGPETGGGFDGLHADGVNRNQGAQSTLALLSTLQHARRFSAVPQ
jgi:hypothetical protein